MNLLSERESMPLAHIFMLQGRTDEQKKALI
jgi:phenylpyruvate tautomerase PptA (4-oxalocrotonate tautomerase family)